MSTTVIVAQPFIKEMKESTGHWPIYLLILSKLCLLKKSQITVISHRAVSFTFLKNRQESHIEGHNNGIN